MKIAAVVVTYNRQELLQRSLNGILNQTLKVDHIFIIDNNSTDQTQEIVKDIYLNKENITYLKLNQNTGSAGGFHSGVKMAHESGADWVWLLDDDVAPKSDCLEEMLKYKDISECIHPSKFDVNGKEFIWESIFNPTTGAVKFLNNISFKNGKKFAFVNMGCFEGMFISRNIIKKIGFPDSRFFIVGDDAIYGFLASLHTNVLYLKDAVITKLIPINEKLSPQFLYYAVRNRFLMKEHIKKSIGGKYIIFDIYTLIFAVYVLLKQTYRNKSIMTPIYVFRGLLDGLRGRFFKI